MALSIAKQQALGHVPIAPEAAALRAKLFDDLAPIDDFAGAIGKSPRVVFHMIARGQIPSVKVGKTRYVIVSKAREALFARQEGSAALPPPRQPGRPRKSA